MSVPDEGYSSNVPDEGYSSNVPDEGYSSNVPDEGYSSNVPDEGYSSNVPDEGYSRNPLCTLSMISTFLVVLTMSFWNIMYSDTCNQKIGKQNKPIGGRKPNFLKRIT